MGAISPSLMFQSCLLTHLCFRYNPCVHYLSKQKMAQTLGWFSDWQVDNPATWRRSSIRHQGPHLDMHVVVQQDVARLEVQVEQGWLNAVEEVHGQTCLMDDTELERPTEVVGRQCILQGTTGHEFHHNAQRLLAYPIDRHNVLKLNLLHFDCFFKETTHLRTMENQEWGQRKGNTNYQGYGQNIPTQYEAS